MDFEHGIFSNYFVIFKIFFSGQVAFSTLILLDNAHLI